MKSLFLIGLLFSSSVYAFEQPTWCNNGKQRTGAEKTVCADEELAKHSLRLDNKWDAYKKIQLDEEKVDQGKKYLKDWNKKFFQPCNTNKPCLMAAIELATNAEFFQALPNGAEQTKLEVEQAKPSALVPIIDITKLAGANKSDVSKLLGETNGCEPSKYGEKCIYEKLDTEIVYVKNKANFITISDLKTVNYDEHAIEYLGLKPAVPDAVGADSLLWKSQQGLLEIKLFKGGEGKVFYAFAKAFADYEEAEKAKQEVDSQATEEVTEKSAPTSDHSNTYKTTASQLYADYEANEVATDEKIGDRPVEVSGVVESIDKDLFGNIVIHLAIGNMFLNAGLTMEDSEKAKAIKVSKGAEVVIECKTMERIMTMPHGQGCIFK